MTALDDAIFNYYSMINQKFVTKMCLTILLPINIIQKFGLLALLKVE